MPETQRLSPATFPTKYPPAAAKAPSPCPLKPAPTSPPSAPTPPPSSAPSRLKTSQLMSSSRCPGHGGIPLIVVQQQDLQLQLEQPGGPHSEGGLRGAATAGLPTSSANTTVALDLITLAALDNAYYVGLQLSLGLFTSDQALLMQANLSAAVKNNADHPGGWATKFARAMVKMVGIEAKTGTQGQISRNCHIVNNGSLENTMAGKKEMATEVETFGYF